MFRCTCDDFAKEILMNFGLLLKKIEEKYKIQDDYDYSIFQ